MISNHKRLFHSIRVFLVGFLCKWINCVQYFQLKLLAFYGRFILYLVINIVDSMSVKSVWIIVLYRLLLIVTIFVFPAIKIIVVNPLSLLPDYYLRHWCFSFALGAKRKEYVQLWHGIAEFKLKTSILYFIFTLMSFS